jgi:signal recognition particle subunit SRP54
MRWKDLILSDHQGQFMFENLTDRLSTTFKNLRGQGRLTEKNISDALREVRSALLEADVALPVVKAFIDQVRERAVGSEVLKSLTPGQVVVKIVYDELVTLMGESASEIQLNVRPPAVILLAGLQGAGKTTTAAKLARRLQTQQKKKVMLASCDVYRPAAIEQLQTLANDIEAQFFPSEVGQKPVDIARSALDEAKKRFADVLIIDTAGRLHIDDVMMQEVQEIHAAVTPVETLFVVDSMTGQDAALTAQAFDQALPLTGVILTKADGDARGGAVLSVRQITGKPIKFIGMGEKTDDLDLFHPDRIASRILGMGDVLSLVEEVQQKVDQEKAEKLVRKLSRGKRFDLQDYRDQLQQMVEMGGISSLMDKLPGVGNLPASVKDQVSDKQTLRMIAIINSMTIQERKYPALIKGGRKARIARGSGTGVPDVNRLLKQYMQTEKMMSKLSRGGIKKLLRGMSGRLPPGLGLN